MNNDLKKRLDETTLQPDPSVWDNIQHQMQHRAVVRRRAAVVGAAAVLVTAGLVALGLHRTPSDTPTREVAQLQTVAPVTPMPESEAQPVTTPVAHKTTQPTSNTPTASTPSVRQAGGQLVGVDPANIPAQRRHTAQNVVTTTVTAEPAAAPTATTVEPAPRQVATNAATTETRPAPKASAVGNDEQLLYIPNAFAPDDPSDKVRRFKVVAREGSQIVSYSIHIYNRGGKLVYVSHDINSAWDGKMNNIPQPMGTYAYVIEYRDAQQGLKQHRGSLTLVR